MALPLYLAMTSSEFMTCPLPERAAYMACHFSLYGQGLENIPEHLPRDSILILNDRVPVWDHDPDLAVRQLQQAVDTTGAAGVLLDFQVSGQTRCREIAKAAIDTLSCPVAVTEAYGLDLDCILFLPAPSLHQSFTEWLRLWDGREIWIEAATESVRCQITREEAKLEPIPFQSVLPHCHIHPALGCRYSVENLDDRVVFTLTRTREDLLAALEIWDGHGITKAIGLYQQLGDENAKTPQTKVCGVEAQNQEGY